ncbi:relaxase/mobilization nuclease domain-containing protein [Pseudomonas serbica]|uniref:relaxase/mobilization nuclease domain-containing protein n=1 Tax=Pseudomonas serbica TaxID=2965074 RepID=UPI00237B5214|nr:relaxase/mobilization nuclease domain-containing protein [Pseudomonas serbica]
MINGLSIHTVHAASAAAYFLDDLFFDTDANVDLDLDYDDPERKGVWREREPRPVLLEGDPAQMVALCNSLTFKNKYTTGVLSFSPAETALIDATPGLKENLIKEIKDFAYAGVKNDDSKPIMVVQHTHTGRLELNYMFPRVHMESGKYFNPFPPNYNGKTGKGSAQLFIDHNNAFVDYVCSKYGLQNPRDPQYAQEIKINKFDPAKVEKKLINAEVSKLVGSGQIQSRDDVVNFLKNSGGTITRLGKDYISVKYDDQSRAIRLRGSYYGEQSHDAIRASLEAAKEKLNRSPAEFEATFREVQEFRAGEVEKRHDLKGLAAELASGFDTRSTAELKNYGDELQATKDSLPGYDDYRGRVNGALINDSSSLITESAESGAGIESGIAESGSDADPILTGNPSSDQLIRAFHQMQKKLAAEEMQRVKRSHQIDPQQEKMVRELTDLITKFFGGLAIGKNLVHGRPGAMTANDIALFRQMVSEQQRELQRELRAVATVVKRREKAEPLQDILKPAEPEPERVEAKPAQPAPLSPHLSKFITDNVVLNKSKDIDTIGTKRVLRPGWLSDKMHLVRDEANFWAKPFDPTAVERGLIEAMARQKIPALEAYKAVLKESAVSRDDARYAADVVSREYTRAALKAEGQPRIDLDAEAKKRYPELLKRAESGIDAELKAIHGQARQGAEAEQQLLDELAEQKRLELEQQRAERLKLDRDSSLTLG